MTLSKVISRIDEMKPITYTHEQKIEWLSELDARIKAEIIDTHEGGENVPFDGYDEKDTETELLVPSPFTEVYIYWLEAKIDYANSEIGRYNNSIANFNTSFNSYANYYNRHNMPLTQKLRFF